MADDCALYREVLYWRELLGRVASELELKAGLETDRHRARWMSARAMRIRRRLYEGVPAECDVAPNQDFASGRRSS